MLRLINTNIRAVIKEIEAKILALPRRALAENDEHTLAERLTLFSGLCGQSIQFNEQLERLQQWLFDNVHDFAYKRVQMLEEELLNNVNILESYIANKENIEDLGTNFDKKRVLDDTGSLQRLREHIMVVLAALQNYRTVKRDEYLKTLTERAKKNSSSSGFNLFGIFSHSKNASESRVVALMSQLSDTLEAGPAAVAEKAPQAAPSTPGCSA